MRALRFDRYGPADVLHVAEIPEPAPDPGEVKVRVHAVCLNPLDWKIRAGHLRFVPLLRGPPRGLGTDFAGEIVGVGGGAMARHVGERVFGSLMPFARQGALAEHVVVAADRVVPIPGDLSYDAMATLPVAAGTALQALADVARLGTGQRAIITGAAGGVGHFAVQLAKHLGAHVVGVCSAGNAAFVRAQGADEVVDYASGDFTRRADRFDVVFDAAGASTFSAARRVLGESGCYINTCGDTAAALGTAAYAIVARLTSRQRAIPFALKNTPATWQRLAVLVQDGVLRPHVERMIALEDVSGAQQSMESGHGRGKIVVRIAGPR
jgi:NADPH:quinone reductase-like Zn-dependent oxidoreductase